MATVAFKLTIVLLGLAVLNVSVKSERKPWNECKGKSQLGQPCNDGAGICTEVDDQNGERYGQMECTIAGTVCSLPYDTGPCDDQLRRYFYDSAAQYCQKFQYGGCEGNENNFETLQECENACMTQ